ncbi:MAG: hypothetical protein HYY16_17880 [Planctomycetes bacterium]|nr:hypothetical protein [Planctomycetota bacterium]
MLRFFSTLSAAVVSCCLMGTPSAPQDTQVYEEYHEGNVTVTLVSREKTEETVKLAFLVKETPDEETVKARRAHEGTTYQFHPNAVAEADAKVKEAGETTPYMAGWVVTPPKLPMEAEIQDPKGEVLYVCAAETMGFRPFDRFTYTIDLKELAAAGVQPYRLVLRIPCFKISQDSLQILGEEVFRVSIWASCSCGKLHVRCTHCASAMESTAGAKPASSCPSAQGFPEAG